MNKMLSTAELQIVGMTKKEKLLRWARLIREASYQLYAWRGIEYCDMYQLNGLSNSNSAFSLAANDPIFQDAGIAGHTVGDSMRFFELSQTELHPFSCDCHGTIHNEDMASRIELLASNS